MRFVKEGTPFICFPVLSGLVLILLSKNLIPVGLILIILGLFCLYFFRDPKRTITDNKSEVICPADGKVIDIEKADGNNIVKIFMSVFNVHIQRAPVSGIIKNIEYKRGKFMHAMSKTADKENEQNIITISTPEGSFTVKQIAGILARRIVCWVKPGDKVEKGDKIGFIRFGSQVDICVPDSIELKVKQGEKVVAGETIIARR